MGERICLIVDDEPAIRTYLRVVLNGEGFRCLEAGSAVESLRILQKEGNQIDLLITDVRMLGDMDGIDLAHAVKDSHPSLPVILVSGYAGRNPGGFHFVQKPFMPDAIVKAIDNAMTGLVPASAR